MGQNVVAASTYIFNTCNKHDGCAKQHMVGCNALSEVQLLLCTTSTIYPAVAAEWYSTAHVDAPAPAGYLVSWGFLEGEGYQASLPLASNSNQPTLHDLSKLLGSFLYCSQPSLKIATNSLFTCNQPIIVPRQCAKNTMRAVSMPSLLKELYWLTHLTCMLPQPELCYDIWCIQLWIICMQCYTYVF